jgi:hypothetical protein
MKKILYLCLISLLTLFLQCSTEESPLESGNEKVQFTVAIPSSSESGGRMKGDLPDGVSVLISINNSSGSPVTTLQRINLLKIGEGYITEPLELKPGNYSITDFLIVIDSEVLFATPKYGSPLASVITRPLPSNFSVGRNSVSNIDMQVVSTKDKDPQSFGYVSFSVDVMSPLQISVLLIENETASFTTAQADIYDGENLIHTYSLGAKVNTIGFSEDREKTYSIVIHKRGYGQFKRYFTYNALVEELGGQPLKVTLEPTVELEIISIYGEEEPFALTLTGSGKVKIKGSEWFSGTYTLPVEFTELYLPDGNYSIEITGDIQMITGLESFGYHTGIKTMVGFQHMTALQGFSPGMYFNDEIDFSHNAHIKFIDLWFLESPDWLILPEDHSIKIFTLFLTENPASGEQLDRLLNNIHRNAVEKSIHNGSFSFADTEYPSSAAMDKLFELHDVYGWEINVNDYDFE